MQISPVSHPDQPASPTQPSSQDLQRGAEFLLTDFQQLGAFMERAEAFISRSADILVALVSGLAAAIAFLPQSIYAKQIPIIMMFAIIAVLTMGLLAFRQAVRRDIQVTNYARAMNRIRAYFAEHAPPIQQYVMMPVVHTYPVYGRRARGREVILGLNSLLVGSFVIAVNAQFGTPKIPSLDSVQILVGEFVVSFVIVFLAHYIYAKFSFMRAEHRSSNASNRPQGLYGIYSELGK